MARLGAAGPLAIAWAVMPILGSLVLFANADSIGTMVREQGVPGWFMFVAGFAVLTGLALLPTYALSGMAGYIFSSLALGAPAAVLGCVGGSIIGYVVARAASGDRVARVVDENPKWKAIRDALVGERHSFKRTLGIVTLLRLPPNSPFAMTNLALAAVRVRPSVYFLGTLLGITPRTVLAASIGVGVASFQKDWDSALPRWVLYAGIGLGVAVILVIGNIASKAMAKIGADGAPAKET